MKAYLFLGLFVVLIGVTWKVYAAGYDLAESRHIAQAATALRDAEAEASKRADNERSAKERAEADARAIEEEANKTADRLYSVIEELGTCDQQCYVLEWPQP